jgi:hypothetical protein
MADTRSQAEIACAAHLRKALYELKQAADAATDAGYGDQFQLALEETKQSLDHVLRMLS